jgi:hypothetical protein
MCKKTDVLLMIFGDILGTVTRLFLQSYWKELSIEKFSGSKLILGISF